MASEVLPLREIHLPAPIGIWPLAPGWWLLLSSIIIVASVLIAWVLYLRRPTPLLQALNALDDILQTQCLSPDQKSQALSIILRKLAITTHPRVEVAALSGQSWHHWVQSQLHGKTLSPEFARFLEIGPFNANLNEFPSSEAFYEELRETLTAIANEKAFDFNHCTNFLKLGYQKLFGR